MNTKGKIHQTEHTSTREKIQTAAVLKRRLASMGALCLMFSTVLSLQALQDDLKANSVAEKNRKAMHKKHYAKYVEAFISDIIDQMNMDDYEGVLNMMKFTYCTFLFTPIRMAITDYSFLHYKLLKALLFYINSDLQPTHHSAHFLQVEEVVFFLKLEKTLASNIHLNDFRIFGLHSVCQYFLKVTHFHTHPQFEFKLCGIYSSTNIYPPSSDIQVLLSFGVHHKNSLNMHVMFDIIASKVIVTTKFEAEKPNKPHTVWLCLLQEIEESFHFVSSKLMQVKIRLNCSLTQAIVYNGPGIFSKWTSFTKEVLCSSFQCLMQISQKELAPDKCHIRYSPQAPAQKWQKNLTVGQRGLYKYRLRLNNKQNFWSLMIRTSESNHINLSIAYWKFKGKEHPECLHGGVSLCEETQSGQTEKETLCLNKRKAALFLRNVYTNTAMCTIVTYTYAKYGSLGFRIMISSTACSLVKMNLCKKRQEYLSLGLQNSVVKTLLGRSSRHYSKRISQLEDRQHIDIKKTSNCTMVDVFVKFDSHCSIVPISDTELGYLSYKSYIFITYRQDTNQMLKYHLRGIIANKSGFEIQPYMSLVPYFTIAGTDIYHNKQRDIHIIEIHKTGMHEISNQGYNSVYNKSLFPPRFVSERSFYPFMHLLPRPRTDWIFQSTMYSRTPTHKGSPQFLLSFHGDASWLEICISFLNITGKGVLQLNLGGEPMPVLKLPSQEAVVFEINKDNLVGRNLQLQINVSLKVNWTVP